ncbi:MAG TPA: cache domain-containing protein, partial [Fibrobacteraceae bacterium]|nr:cache domain-containing protein [Fibrobacteraceae bacterium]
MHTRKGLWALLPVALVLIAGFAWWSGSHNRKEAEAELSSRLSAQAKFRADKLDAEMNKLRKDVMFLAAVPPIQGIVRASQSEGFDVKDSSALKTWRKRLETIFLAYARTNEDFFQLRFIGVKDRGREIVRVDHRQDSVFSVPENELQYKGDRDYFQQAIQYPKGEVFVSSLDLNQEYGKVEKPTIPTMRVATPIQDSMGRPFGIVILNIYARHMLQNFQKDIPSNFLGFLVNQDGDYLSHENHQKTFG